MDLTPGSLLERGKYRIIDTLGRGGFGITYLAEQVMAKRKVCIKEFFPKDYYKRDEDTSALSLFSESNAEVMGKFKAKFIKEAQTIASLDHAHIIHIHDVFEENNTAYYVMEYIEGESLSALVKRCGALDEAIAVTYIRHIADALDYIHEQKINHLDVKPGNIMVRTKDDNAILIDFGLAKHYDDGGDQTSSTPVGISHGYAPFEQYKSGGVSSFSPATDIYSLGATLYYLVTGKVPPSATDIEEDGIGALLQHISPGIYATIEKSMNFWRKQRPQSIKEFLALLDGKDTVTPNIETTAIHIEVADSKTELLPKVEPSKSALPREEIQPNNEIWYTSSDGNVVEPSNQVIDRFGAEIVSNTYKDGKGIIKFKGDVTTIGKYAFAYCKHLTSVTIPNSVTTIGEYAFTHCGSLTSVTIPNSVTTIGYYTFSGCSALKSVTIPDSVTTIGNSAFSGCNSLTSVTIPNSVTMIGYYTFSGCSALKSVTIPDSVTTIGNSAFSGCNSLTSVTIPNSVTTIGNSAFSGCNSLTSATIPNSVATIGEGAFADCRNLKEFKGGFAFSNGRCLIINGKLVAFAPAGITNFTIPDSVTTIGEWAFYHCESLNSVTIPNSVKTIGEWAFYYCDNLTSVTIPDSVTSIGEWAFADCNKLSRWTKNKINSINPDAKL